MPEFYYGIIVNQTVITVVLFGLSHYHRYWIKKKQILRQPVLSVIGKLLVSAFLLSVLAQVLITPALVLLVDQPVQNYHWTHSLGYLANTYMVLLIWVVLYASIKAVMRQRQTEIDKWRLQAELKNAELHRLREQINPHFIFNALNNIRSLVTENPELARDAITMLSNLLRSALRFQDRHLIPMNLELELVRDYLELEKIQLEDRLSVLWQLEVPPEEIKMPAMSLQILVENAIKYGISNRKNGGTLRIETCRSNGDIIVRVTNPGSLTQNPDAVGGNGTGLKNVRERLTSLMGKQATLTLTSANEHVIAEMRWPAVKQNIQQSPAIHANSAGADAVESAPA
jgi:LytS/YehU family sensor histidine kinase